MQLKNVLKQLIDARNQNLILHVETWPSAERRFSRVTIKFLDSTPQANIVSLALHFQHRYKCTHIQKYNIGSAQFLTFVFPEVLKSVLDEET